MLILSVIKWVFIAVFAGTLIYKFYFISIHKNDYMEDVDIKWIGRYNSMQVKGTSNPSEREFMKTCNRLYSRSLLFLILILLLQYIPHILEYFRIFINS